MTPYNTIGIVIAVAALLYAVEQLLSIRRIEKMVDKLEEEKEKRR